MRVALVRWTVLASWFFAAPVAAQQPAPAASGPLRLALQTPASILSPQLPMWWEPSPKRIGFLTIVQPDTSGEMFKASVPIGELITRAAHALAHARYARAEKSARERSSVS